jgi:hypothetical protein
MLALSCALILFAGVATVLVRARDNASPRYPTVRVASDATGYTVRWMNRTHVDYDPLTVHTIFYTKHGLIQRTFLRAGVDHLPGCCEIRLPHGGSTTIHFPPMRHPVGWIEFVDLYYGGLKSQQALPRILCTRHLNDRITCIPERSDL